MVSGSLWRDPNQRAGRGRARLVEVVKEAKSQELPARKGLSDKQIHHAAHYQAQQGVGRMDNIVLPQSHLNDLIGTIETLRADNAALRERVAALQQEVKSWNRENEETIKRFSAMGICQTCGKPLEGGYVGIQGLKYHCTDVCLPAAVLKESEITPPFVLAMQKRIALLEKMAKQAIGYIEEMEVKVDGEWGDCLNLEELLEQGKMPALYYGLISCLKEDGV
jgi:hypothetical protein